MTDLLASLLDPNTHAKAWQYALCSGDLTVGTFEEFTSAIKATAEVLTLDGRQIDDDPIYAILSEWELPGGADAHEEQEHALAIILKSGFHYPNVVVFDFESEDRVVLVHDLANEGRRCRILISEIAAVDCRYDT